MYNRPICGRSTGAYTNLGDLQRDLRGLSPTPPNNKNKKNKIIKKKSTSEHFLHGEVCSKRMALVSSVLFEELFLHIISCEAL
jgi:hypothetical protein